MKYLAIARTTSLAGLMYDRDVFFRSAFVVVALVVFVQLWTTTFAVAGGPTYDGSANYPAATTVVKTFLCPADPAGDRVPGSPYGATSYAANAGSGKLCAAN